MIIIIKDRFGPLVCFLLGLLVLSPDGPLPISAAEKNKNMNMGPNRVILKSAGPGTYEGRGIIVRCPSGRKIWRATVKIPDIGQAEFIFNVIY